MVIGQNSRLAGLILTNTSLMASDIPLTLHDKSNRRILGFDNAHAMKPLRKRYRARKVTWDHRHKTEKISSYEYESASRLLEDFWLEVEQMLGKR